MTPNNRDSARADCRAAGRIGARRADSVIRLSKWRHAPRALPSAGRAILPMARKTPTNALRRRLANRAGLRTVPLRLSAADQDDSARTCRRIDPARPEPHRSRNSARLTTGPSAPTALCGSAGPTGLLRFAPVARRATGQPQHFLRLPERFPAQTRKFARCAPSRHASREFLA